MPHQRETSTLRAVLRLRIAGAFAIALLLAIAGFRAASCTPAFAQGEPSAKAQTASASAAAATPQPAAALSLVPVNASAAAQSPHAQAVISYLSDVINWYRHLGVEAQLVRDPDETLFFADDRQVAGEILRLAFEYARAQAAFIAKTSPSAAAGGSGASPPAAAGLSNITQAYEKLDAQADVLRKRIGNLQAQLAKAPARQRAGLASQIQNAQSEFDLNQARGDALKALAQFESGKVSPEQNAGLIPQIDELEHSIAESNSKQPPSVPVGIASTARPEPTGILGLGADLLALSNKLDTLDQSIALAQALAARATAVRKSILAVITGLDASARALEQGAGVADVTTLNERKKAFDNLLEERKLASLAGLPLTKQIVLLGIYTNNVGRWHAAVDQQWNSEFRSLMVRLIVLSAFLALIFLGSLAWRWLTNRYVTDIRRRGQVMAARRLVLGLMIVIVLLFNFSSEIGSAATIVGFAAAGIAVALQNVILSIAGYFFLIGRFGIKVGDRVQVGGVTGDVIDIGLVKLSLMELGGDGTHHEPTGRVAVFSNAIVFQPSGNFFRQAPGTSFVWNEVRLTLAPDVDYRLAEKRLLEAVEEVFARYRDRVMRDYRRLQRDLNIMLETPKPQSRLRLDQTGLEIIIRYPAETHTAPQITDEISRRVLDAINRDPNLRLAPQGTANIQAEIAPPAAADREKEAAVNDGQPGDTPPNVAAANKAASATPQDK